MIFLKGSKSKIKKFEFSSGKIGWGGGSFSDFFYKQCKKKKKIVCVCVFFFSFLGRGRGLE